MVSMAHIAQEFRPLTKCATSTRREKHLQRRQERCGCYRLPAQRLSTRTYLLQSDPSGQLEVLDGQQRITSFGRFVTDKFAILHNGRETYFSGLDDVLKEKILKSRLVVFVCKGTEPEIKEWFETINIVGVPLNSQERRNAVHSGPFVTAAKAVFSNSQNAEIQKWSHYVRGDVKRQQYLECALDWISRAKGKTIDAI